MIEKRKYHRLLLKVDIKEAGLSGIGGDKAETRNLSSGGICITTHADPLKVADVFQLEFSLPGREVIRVRGKVVWNRAYNESGTVLYDNGIEFLEMSDHHRDMIKDHSIGSLEEK